MYETEKRSGIIQNLWRPDPDKDLWLLQFEGSDERFSGFGAIPEILQDASDQGKKVEIGFVTKLIDSKVYLNFVDDSARVIEEKEEEKKAPGKEKKKEKEPKQGKLGTTNEEIVLIVSGNITGRLTQDKLDKYEDKYLKYVKRTLDKIEPGFQEDAFFKLAADKLISPFFYWIKDQITVDAYNEKLKNGKKEN